MSKTIGIISGKGGVGKTTLAVNIAATLHALEEDTLLVDANISNPHVGIMLGNYSTRECLHDVLTQHSSPIQSIHYHPTGLKIVPGSINPQQHEGGLDMSLLGAYASFAKHVIFDGPPGDHSHVLATANEVVIVTTTDEASLLDARRSIEQAEEAGTNIIGIVVNKYRGRKKDEKQESLEGFLGYPVLGFIAEDDKFLEAAKMQVPYCWLNPKSPATKTFKEIATRIVGIPNETI